MLRLMCITAHPDDEAGSFGGILRLYRDQGCETSVICLTPGQAASHRGGAKSDQELAQMRQQEFAASCAILRVSKPMILDYPDGQLYRQELNRVVYDLTYQVRQFRPHVMVTFGPDGGVTGHADHSLAGIFAALAYQWAGRSNRYRDQFSSGISPHRTQKLYYSTADFAMAERQPISLSPATAIIDIGNHLETKIGAFKAHKTQAPLWPVFEENVRKRGAREMFHLAAATKLGPGTAETDLFECIEEND